MELNIEQIILDLLCSRCCIAVKDCDDILITIKMLGGYYV